MRGIDLRAGEVIEVRAGEVVPADARILWADAGEVDESLLTGESLPVVKHVDSTPGAPLAERACMLYEGTVLLTGTVLAVVTATGAATESGRAVALSPSRSRDVGLQAQLSRLTSSVLPMTVAGGLAVTGLGLLRGTGIRETVASGVSISVAAVPEGLPLIAGDLAAMLRAGRAVVSANQDRINDPAKGQQGLDGAGFLAQSVAQFTQATGKNPASIDLGSRDGRLLRMEMDAIVEVIDANQPTFKAPGPTFKGFIPAVFSRLVSESFNRRAGAEAEMKVTAPPSLVRNRKSRPDAWELSAITAHFEQPGWPKGDAFSAVIEQPGARPLFRIAVPEYYVASCLSCHGTPKGATDLTGYPMEGASLGDLGGVISIKLAR